VITVNDTFAPVDLVEGVAAETDHFGFVYGWKSQSKYEFGHWNHDVLGTPIWQKEDARALFPPEPEYKPIWKLWELHEGVFGKADLLRCYLNQHTYGVEGYAHPDSDDTGDMTSIIYLNRTWERDWGGETTFFDDEEIIKAVLPKFGRLVSFPSEIWHCARAVSRICPQARVTLIYKYRIR
jgi:SM-20-related protein